MQTIEVLSALAHIATALAVGVAAFQLRAAHKQSITSFEDSLTKEYREVASNLPLKALLGESLEDREHQDHLKYFYRYFDLCNEQAFLHKVGRISDPTWKFWQDGILTNLRRPAFARAWCEIAHRANDDFSELRAICSPEDEFFHHSTDA
ncbi:MAG: hypothetical protein Q7S69_05015 [Nitrosomonadaceae bacterium]|nr:hypothetical protein [Nitrosomonadaceae bacterium]